MIRVLIADDSSVVRDGLRSIMDPHDDVEVVGEASEGLETVDKTRSLEPNVLLVDAQLNGLNSLEIIRQIKERWPRVKILLLTVHVKPIGPALAAGADGYLLKDSNRHQLLQALRELAVRE